MRFSRMCFRCVHFCAIFAAFYLSVRPETKTDRNADTPYEKKLKNRQFHKRLVSVNWKASFFAVHPDITNVILSGHRSESEVKNDFF